ncbi:MAG: hypothetical protein VXZ96_01565 [Myxococcota bacterium]|nr:hypothetical protein [Myxococcota bacterium]
MLLYLFSLTSCSMRIPLPSESLNALAEEVCLVGHPTATFKAAKIVKYSPKITGERSIDLEIIYRGILSSTPHAMTVRFTVESLKPCSVRTTVLGDDGAIWPVLLDNSIASPMIGSYICESLSRGK